MTGTSRNFKLFLAVPSTFTVGSPNLFVRTFRIGLLARIAAVFSVRRVFVYHDPDPKFDSHGLGRYVVKVLRYANCPPHLRKLAFPLEKTNRAFGVVPPLNFPREEDDLEWGVILKRRSRRAEVAAASGNYSVRLRKTNGRTLLFSRRRLREVLPEETSSFLGFYAEYVPEGLPELLRSFKGKRIALERGGGRSLPKGPTLVVVGSVFRDAFSLGRNFFTGSFGIPEFYPTKTLRTEEALLIGLSRMVG